MPLHNSSPLLDYTLAELICLCLCAFLLNLPLNFTPKWTSPDDSSGDTLKNR